MAGDTAYIEYLDINAKVISFEKLCIFFVNTTVAVAFESQNQALFPGSTKVDDIFGVKHEQYVVLIAYASLYCNGGKI
jgi:hypothetical protein